MENGRFDALIFSITLNVLVLTTALTSKIFHATVSPTSFWTRFHPSENDNQRSVRQLGSRASRSAVRVLQSIVAPGLALYLVLALRVIVEPFKFNSWETAAFFSAQLAFFCFEFVVPFLDGGKPFSGYSEILNHAVTILMYLGILLTRENTLLGLIGLFIVADGFMQEVVAIFQYFPHRKKSIAYLICLFLYAVSLGTFRIILPAITVTVSLVYSDGKLNDMLTISIGLFFFCLVFMAGYQLWFYVNRMCFIHEEAKKAVQKGQVPTGPLDRVTGVKRLKSSFEILDRKAVQNEYVFDIAAPNTPEKETVVENGKTVVRIAKNVYDNEQTHYFV